LLIFGFTFRRLINLDDAFSILLALIFISAFTLLYASQPRLSRRWRGYTHLYLILQLVIVQLLGLFEEYLDSYALLYIVLAFQVIVIVPRREAYAWLGLFAVSLTITLCLEFGLVSGLGRTLAYIMIGVILISFDIQYAQHEDALAESQLLLSELQEAHQKLAEYASQAEQLSAFEEHQRLARELYDAAGQKIYAIQLAAEAIRRQPASDPPRLVSLLDDLHQQTQEVLLQMRQLIEAWRPG
jgi:signal transduction histidine kinase